MSRQDKASLNKNTLKTAKRLLKYVTSTYKVQFIIVLICILISSIATISVSLSLKYLLDDFIIPLIGQKSPNFGELYMALCVLGGIFLLGVLATFLYTRLMVIIGQGVLKRVRDEMFEHMQTLPIRYFDHNTNGSVMSLYTNDTDTLRQMINQSIPQVLMASLTIVVTFIAMLALSPVLTILAVVIIVVMFLTSKAIGGNSGKYFVRQQLDLAKITGFVEERMNGQRVIKVFNHERVSKEEFDVLNEQLFVSASRAHTFASMMGPIIGNIGNLQFVLTAILGGFLSIAGIGHITLGVMASYLQFTKSFTQPFMQVAQQFNSIIMALAGAERIFQMLDEEPEVDEGYVTLVNAKKSPDGTI
ncbi:MAG: ABC transporter ATP-binding protein, partial [Blautia sp.]